MSIPYDMDLIRIASAPLRCDIKRLSGWWGKSKKEEEGLRIHLQSISSSMTWRHCQGMWPIIELLPPATETQMQPKIMSFQNSSATNFEASHACSVLRHFTFQGATILYWLVWQRQFFRSIHTKASQQSLWMATTKQKFNNFKFWSAPMSTDVLFYFLMLRTH